MSPRQERVCKLNLGKRTKQIDQNCLLFWLCDSNDHHQSIENKVILWSMPLCSNYYFCHEKLKVRFIIDERSCLSCLFIHAFHSWWQPFNFCLNLGLFSSCLQRHHLGPCSQWRHLGLCWQRRHLGHCLQRRYLGSCLQRHHLGLRKSCRRRDERGEMTPVSCCWLSAPSLIKYELVILNNYTNNLAYLLVVIHFMG